MMKKTYEVIFNVTAIYNGNFKEELITGTLDFIKAYVIYTCIMHNFHCAEVIDDSTGEVILSFDKD